MPNRFLKFKIMFAIHFLIMIALISRTAASEDGLVIKIGIVQSIKKFFKITE